MLSASFGVSDLLAGRVRSFIVWTRCREESRGRQATVNSLRRNVRESLGDNLVHICTTTLNTPPSTEYIVHIHRETTHLLVQALAIKGVGDEGRGDDGRSSEECNGCCTFMTLSRMLKKCFPVSGLVKKSATLSSVGT